RRLERLAHGEDELVEVVAHEAALALGEGVLQDDGHQVVVNVGAGLGGSAPRVFAHRVHDHVRDRRRRGAGGVLPYLRAGHASLRPLPPSSSFYGRARGRRVTKGSPRGPRLSLDPSTSAGPIDT